MQNETEKPTATVALSIIVIFVVFGCLWVIITDMLLKGASADVAILSRYQSVKDIAFILAAGVAMFFLIDKVLHAQDSKNRQLQNVADIFRNLVEGSPFCIYIIQGEKIVYANKKLTDLLGYEPDELYSADSIYGVIEESDRDNVKKHIEARFREETEKESYAVRCLKKDGSVVELQTHDSLIVFGGKPAIVGSLMDISEIKRTEANICLERRLEAISALAGAITHEFNNLMSVVQGSAEILRMRIPKENPSHEEISAILSASHRAVGLVEGLLSFGTKKDLHKIPLDLNALMRSLECLFVSLIGTDISLKTSLCGEDLNVSADIGRLEEAILNLVLFERESMPKGGALSIETSSVDVDKESADKIGYVLPGRYALISISDTGPGMSKDVRDRIFEPFFAKKQDGQTMGLGLPSVHGTIRQHDGFINAESSPEKGTRFEIYLPISDEKTQYEFPDKILSGLGGSENILLAEDRTEVRKFIKTVLEEFGYKVAEAMDGVDAIEKLRSSQTFFDLAVIDIIMPRLSGRDVYEEIKRTSPKTGVIYISGYGEEYARQKGLMTNGADFISKPISSEELLSKVRSTIDKTRDKA